MLPIQDAIPRLRPPVVVTTLIVISALVFVVEDMMSAARAATADGRVYSAAKDGRTVSADLMVLLQVSRNGAA